jgi:hypothetical protein
LISSKDVLPQKHPETTPGTEIHPQIIGKIVLGIIRTLGETPASDL